MIFHSLEAGMKVHQLPAFDQRHIEHFTGEEQCRASALYSLLRELVVPLRICFPFGRSKKWARIRVVRPKSAMKTRFSAERTTCKFSIEGHGSNFDRSRENGKDRSSHHLLQRNNAHQGHQRQHAGKAVAQYLHGL